MKCDPAWFLALLLLAFSGPPVARGQNELGARNWRPPLFNTVSATGREASVLLLLDGLPQAALERQLQWPQEGEAIRRLEPEADATHVWHILRELQGATPRHVLEEVVRRGNGGSFEARRAATEASWILGDLDVVLAEWLAGLTTENLKEQVRAFLQRLSTVSEDLLQSHAGAVRRFLELVEPDPELHALDLLLLEHRIEPTGSRWRQHVEDVLRRAPDDLADRMPRLELESGDPAAAVAWSLWQLRQERTGLARGITRQTEGLATLFEGLAALGLSDWRPREQWLAKAIDVARAERSPSKAHERWDRTDVRGELVALEPRCGELLNEVLGLRGRALVYRYGPRWQSHAEAFTRWQQTCTWPSPVLPRRLRPLTETADALRWRASRWLGRREFLRAARDFDKLVSAKDGQRYVPEALLALRAAGLTRKDSQAVEVLEMARSWVDLEVLETRSMEGPGVAELMDLEESVNPENEVVLRYRRGRAKLRADDPKTLRDLARVFIRIHRPDLALPYAVMAVSLTEDSDAERAKALRLADLSLRSTGWPWEVTVSGYQVVGPAREAHLKDPDHFPKNECSWILDRMITEASKEPRNWQSHPSFNEYFTTACTLPGALRPGDAARHLRIPRE